MRFRIAPSLLSADFSRLDREVAAVESADLLHLDVMDGLFVPNLTFGPPVIATLRRHTNLLLDAHLMVRQPEVLYGGLAAAGVGRISVHCEVCTHLHRQLQGIRNLGISPGVALNPATPLSAIEESLAWVDFVLVMSVDPGFGGQKFIRESLDKITRLRAMRQDLDIAVDGGVTGENAGELVQAGATTLVAGSAVFSEKDRAAAISNIRKAGVRAAGQGAT